jgi:hypothetical protein
MAASKLGGVPAAVELAPTAPPPPPPPPPPPVAPFVQLGEEGPVTHLRAQVAGILEQAFGQVEAGHRRVGVLLAHEVGVLAEDGRLHVARADHVVRHQQELAPFGPAVARHHVGQLWRGAGLRVAGQQQVQHRHEVALARAETAVQVGRLAAAGLHRLLDEAQRVAEGIHQLRRDDVVAQRLLGSVTPLDS